jgi:hypothetical protein
VNLPSLSTVSVDPTVPPIRHANTVTARVLRPMLGSAVVVRTASRTLSGTLLSCVTGSAWLVADDDTDVVLRLNEVLSVRSI